MTWPGDRPGGVHLREKEDHHRHGVWFYFWFGLAFFALGYIVARLGALPPLPP
jgi:hypothetical protein